jgi:hypothetical protein
MDGNYETALKAEYKRVVRCFNAYSSEMRAMHASSYRLGPQQRASLGDFYYVHPDIPNVAFSTRSRAAKAALRQQT